MVINNLFQRVTYKNLVETMQNNKYENIIAWGLSKKTKEIIDRQHIKIDYIVDNNKDLLNSNFKGIPIVDFKNINNKQNLLLLWGNHCEDVLNSISLNEIFVEILLVSDETHSTLGITKDYFVSDHSIKQKQILFKNIVKHIEIEPHSYCNRICWFCPNSFIDRKHTTNYMNEDILEQLLKDLSNIQYNNTISFTRYSEPFGNDIFYATLKKVKKYLPNATLHANTNSDFLNNQTLNKAYTHGLNSLLIQIYLDKDEEFSFHNIDKKANKIMKKISNVKIELLLNKSDWVEYRCTYKNMNIKMYARNFKQNGVNRGGLKVLDSTYERFSPCDVIFTDVYIDYNSKIVPCCNIRSDNPHQSKMIFGEIRNIENSIFNNYFTEIAIMWRKHLFSFSKKQFNPCATCNFRIIRDNNIHRMHIDKILTK